MSSSLRNNEVEDSAELGRVRGRQHEDGEPEAHGAHDEVDPVAGEHVGPAETLADEDGRARGEDGTRNGENVNEVGQGGVPSRRPGTRRYGTGAAAGRTPSASRSCRKAGGMGRRTSRTWRFGPRPGPASDASHCRVRERELLRCGSEGNAVRPSEGAPRQGRHRPESRMRIPASSSRTRRMLDTSWRLEPEPAGLAEGVEGRASHRGAHAEGARHVQGEPEVLVAEAHHEARGEVVGQRLGPHDLVDLGVLDRQAGPGAERQALRRRAAIDRAR